MRFLQLLSVMELRWPRMMVVSLIAFSPLLVPSAALAQNLSDVTGPNLSDVTGPNLSDVTGPNLDDVIPDDPSSGGGNGSSGGPGGGNGSGGPGGGNGSGNELSEDPEDSPIEESAQFGLPRGDGAGAAGFQGPNANTFLAEQIRQANRACLEQTSLERNSSTRRFSREPGADDAVASACAECIRLLQIAQEVLTTQEPNTQSAATGRRIW